MYRTKTNIETPSTSFKDATKKRKKTLEKKNNRTKCVASLSLCENEAESHQDNNEGDKIKKKGLTTTTTDGGGTSSSSIIKRKTENLSTPKREKSFSEMETPEARTQTRLTLKYDDLLLSQTIDPQCEVSWECISPEVVQKIHRDIQRKPNLDISKILALLTDEDDAPSNSSSYINTLLNAKQNVPCSKEVPSKRTLKSTRKTATDTKMEEMIRKLEMRIKSDAENQTADDSMNHKRITDPLEIIQPIQNTPSQSQKRTFSNRNSTKCLPSASEPTSSGIKNTTHNRSFNSCLGNNEETSWSDDDLFCDESFIAKVTQTSENKTKLQNSAAVTSSKQFVIADKKTTPTSSKTSSLGPKRTDFKKQKEMKTGSVKEFPKPAKLAAVVSKTQTNSVHQSENSVSKDLLQDDLDLGFSDSDTDELLSQLTEQEICSALQSSDKRSSKSLPVENVTTISDSVPADCEIDKNVSVIKKTPVDSYLEFLDIPSNSCRKPSPAKKSLKKKAYSFKSVKNSQIINNMPTTCSAPQKQIDIDPAIDQDSSFDDPFSDKDDDILRFAESLDQTEAVKAPEEKKTFSSFVQTTKQIDPKPKNVCTKEEIERKKREALNRRKKIGVMTRGNMK